MTRSTLSPSGSLETSTSGDFKAGSSKAQCLGHSRPQVVTSHTKGPGFESIPQLISAVPLFTVKSEHIKRVREKACSNYTRD